MKHIKFFPINEDDDEDSDSSMPEIKMKYTYQIRRIEKVIDSCLYV